ncbi:MAG: DNA-3-methyladenine glycosylase I [Planctomycetota bacterium]
MTPPAKPPARCPWCLGDPIYVIYHDTEWGVPQHDDTRLFEALVLDGAQAGLSWLTILKRRENYRRAFDGFDAAKVARYTPKKKAALLADAGIIRNRLKIASAIGNAQAFLKIQAEFGSFAKYFWNFVDGTPIVNRWPALNRVPARTPLSDTISKDLKQRGFSFVGSTIMYAMMQATGLINDHLVKCFRYAQVGRKP